MKTVCIDLKMNKMESRLVTVVRTRVSLHTIQW